MIHNVVQSQQKFYFKSFKPWQRIGEPGDYSLVRITRLFLLLVLGKSVIVIIGAGATGLGIAWDLVLRKIPVTVVEQNGIGFGTSGRFHGLLHSGARYVVTDPTTASDCMDENSILRNVAPSVIEPTNGLFVRVLDDDPAYEQSWLQGCQRANIETRLLSKTQMEDFEHINKTISSAYLVPDAVVEGFGLLQLLSKAIVAKGATLLTNHRLKSISISANEVNGVDIEGSNGSFHLACDAVVNAGGPWASEISKLFQDPISMHLAYGLMIIFANRKLDVVLNRLRPPGDGDIFVPHQKVTIFGTTDIDQSDPQAPKVDQAEVIRLMTLGKQLIPELDSWRVLRAFNGVRPLYEPLDSISNSSRQISRDYKLIDHHLQGGPSGAFSIVGGKLTTFRLMGEKTGDLVSKYLNVSTSCLSSQIPIDSTKPKLVKNDTSTVLCECEDIREQKLRSIDGSIDDWRIETWFGMGPCQGTFCAHRVVGLYHQIYPEKNFEDELAHFRQERIKGMLDVVWGSNAKQFVLQQAIRFQSLAE